MRRAFLLVLVLACHSRTPTPTPTATATATATPASAPPPLSPEALARRAEACFSDPTCPLADATRDVLAADEAGGAPDVDCFRFYYGTGVPEDRARARRCFGRKVGTTTCHDSSPDLARLYLAMMRADAQGGPRDAAGANALLKDCFADISVTGVIEATRTDGPRRCFEPNLGDTTCHVGAIDFCREVGGTMESLGECDAVKLTRADFELQRAEKAFFPTLDAAGKARYQSANEAFARYQGTDAARAGDVHREAMGLIRQLTQRQHATRLRERRASRLASRTALPPASEADVTSAEVKLTALRTRLRKEADAQGRVVFDAAEAAWQAYAAAEVAFYTQAFGVDADAVRAVLVRDRMATLE